MESQTRVQGSDEISITIRTDDYGQHTHHVPSKVKVEFTDGVDQSHSASSGQNVQLKVELPADDLNKKRLIVCLLYGYEFASKETSDSWGREVNVFFVRHTKTLVSGEENKEINVSCQLPTVCPASFSQNLSSWTGDESNDKAKSSGTAGNLTDTNLCIGIRYCCRIVVLPQKYENNVDDLQSKIKEEWLPTAAYHASEGHSKTEHSLGAWESAPGASTARGEIPVLHISDVLEFECSGQPRVPIREQLRAEESGFYCGGCMICYAGTPSWEVVPPRQFPSHTGGSEPAKKQHRLLDEPIGFFKEDKVTEVEKVSMHIVCDRSLLLPGDFFPIHIGVQPSAGVLIEGMSGLGHEVTLKQMCTLKSTSSMVPSGTGTKFVREFNLLYSVAECGNSENPKMEWAQIPYDVIPSGHGAIFEISHNIHVLVMTKIDRIATPRDLELPIQVGKLSQQGVREDGLSDDDQLPNSLLEKRFLDILNHRKMVARKPTPKPTANADDDFEFWMLLFLPLLPLYILGLTLDFCCGCLFHREFERMEMDG